MRAFEICFSNLMEGRNIIAFDSGPAADLVDTNGAAVTAPFVKYALRCNADGSNGLGARDAAMALYGFLLAVLGDRPGDIAMRQRPEVTRIEDPRAQTCVFEASCRLAVIPKGARQGGRLPSDLAESPEG